MIGLGRRPCPVSIGLETRMTEAGFAAACAARKEEDNLTCAECSGIPAEIQIIEIGGDMPQVAREKACDLCMRVMNVKRSHGLDACPSCTGVLSTINQRPDAVLAAWRRVRGGLPGEGSSCNCLRCGQGVGEICAICHHREASEREDLQRRLDEAERRWEEMATAVDKIVVDGDDAHGPGDFRWHIGKACRDMETLLLGKNAAYGNSAADPVRIFCKADPLTQIDVRIDDKLSRLMRGHEYPGDDTEADLLGYLLLKRAVRSWLRENAA